MSNPWLAIDLSEDPRRRAGALRRAWESYLSDGVVGPGVRPVVVQSWQRSTTSGVPPENLLAPVIYNSDDIRDIWQEHPLRRVMPAIRDLLIWVAEEAEHLVVVSDAAGHILAIEGKYTVRSWAERMHFVEGARWSEQAAGTNAIGASLAMDHPIQIFAAEHFSQHVHAWTCSAAPIHDPLTGEILGIIDITSKMHTVHPHSLGLVVAAARAAEAALREIYEKQAARDPSPSLIFLPVSREPERRLSEQPVLHMNALGRDQVMVQIGREQFLLSRRHGEILVLLAQYPSGLSSNRLSFFLYGDLGNPITARAEMSRLRKVLGPWLATNPYRLLLPVEADFMTLRHFLKQGHLLQALKLYQGPLLPGSDAPAIVEMREQLEVWLRRSILARNDLALLQQWVETSAGRDDLEAWEMLLRRLDVRDPLQGQAMARVYQLQ